MIPIRHLYINNRQYYYNEETKEKWPMPCSWCSGMGDISDGYEEWQCPQCNGTGNADGLSDEEHTD